MAKELQDGKELGSESGEMVATWTELYPASIVEEAIIGAKEFLLNPSRLADKIKDLINEDARYRNNNVISLTR